ncbi:MAG TPA: hypothetical protein PKY06_08690, partial [Saprospiraceae bacterium]|nr:hypothetical protein [Saprospiraceae bacterium]
ETAWQPATFDHNKTDFPLTGAHTSVACAQCHTNGYAGTPTACVSCHQDDYNSTTDPNHKSANFPSDCTACHTTNAWTPASFNHDGQYFPIYSGKHRNVWDACSECHTNQNNYAVFDCIHCHRRDHHQDRGSAGCYECHPRGKAD